MLAPSLGPVGSLNKYDALSMGGAFEGTFEYNPAKAYIIGIANPKGKGITIVAVTSSEAYNNQTYKKLAFEVKASVVFSAAKALNSTTSGTLEDWQYQLADTRLTFMESYYSGGENGGGYNMKKEIDLCKAGYFRYYAQNFMSAGGDNASIYSGDNNRGDGQWKIEKQANQFVLVLEFLDGQKAELQLSWGEGKKLFLNGDRFYRTWEGDMRRLF